MSLAYEGNTSLAYDTEAMRSCANRYGEIAEELDELSKNLDTKLKLLSSSGWTTPAGSAFHKMTDRSWQKNIRKYTNLLRTLKKILKSAANEYDDLTSDIRKSKAK
ncbi:MAG: WXG100 family type VII secretion target [Eubacterium sp.]|nr:WXG100 family type VII secretion target [Eubacterium sp.]